MNCLFEISTRSNNIRKIPQIIPGIKSQSDFFWYFWLSYVVLSPGSIVVSLTKCISFLEIKWYKPRPKIIME